MALRLFSLLVWGLVSGTCVFWGLRLFVRPASIPTPAVASSDSMLARGDLSRLFGAAVAEPSQVLIEAPAPEISSRFRLTGVVAPKRPSEQGLAVISVDGKPPRVYRVGASIDGDLMLREVSLRTATVAYARDSQNGAASFVLELPLIAAAATGLLPQIGTVPLPDSDVVPGLNP